MSFVDKPDAVAPADTSKAENMYVVGQADYTQQLVNADKNLQVIMMLIERELRKQEGLDQPEDYYDIHPDQRRILKKMENDPITAELVLRYKALVEAQVQE